MDTQFKTSIFAAALTAGLLVSVSARAAETVGPGEPALQIARHGADDPAGDDRGGRHSSDAVLQIARHGADDPAGDDRGGGNDDPAGDDHGGRHAEASPMQLARHGADDPAGDDRGG